MLLLAVFIYDPLTGIVSLFLADDLVRTAVGLFITLARQSGTRCQMNLEIMKVFMALNDPFYPRDAMLVRVIAIATCLSVCPSRAGIVSKRRKLAA